MIHQLEDTELCEITSTESTAISQCIKGVGCSVFVDGEQLPAWASNEVEEIVGIHLGDVPVTSFGSEVQYFVLNRDKDTDKFTVLRGPMDAEELRKTFHRCSKCGKRLTAANVISKNENESVVACFFCEHKMKVKQDKAAPAKA